MPGRYEQAHKNTRGPGDARPTAEQILQDEGRLDGSLADKVVVITGVSSGIGVPTLEAMAAAGATVYAGVRAESILRAQQALSAVLNDPKTKDKVHLLDLDLTSLASVKAFADDIKKRETKVNILINNAGVMAIASRELTKDGFEMQFGTNHLAHFHLFHCLKDALLAGAKHSPDFASRVVNLSSSGHRMSPVHLDDINLEGDGKYEPWLAYGNSKTANIWMANQIERLYGSHGIHGYSVNPGGIVTPLQKHAPGQTMMAELQKNKAVMDHMKSLEQGAATSVWAATARELEAKGGVYCEDCAVAGPVPKGPENPLIAPGHQTWAYNPEGEERLWSVSLEFCGLNGDS